MIGIVMCDLFLAPFVSHYGTFDSPACTTLLGLFTIGTLFITVRSTTHARTRRAGT